MGGPDAVGSRLCVRSRAGAQENPSNTSASSRMLASTVLADVVLAVASPAVVLLPKHRVFLVIDCRVVDFILYSFVLFCSRF